MSDPRLHRTTQSRSQDGQSDVGPVAASSPAAHHSTTVHGPHHHDRARYALEVLLREPSSSSPPQHDIELQPSPSQDSMLQQYQKSRLPKMGRFKAPRAAAMPMDENIDDDRPVVQKQRQRRQRRNRWKAINICEAVCQDFVDTDAASNHDLEEDDDDDEINTHHPQQQRQQTQEEEEEEDEEKEQLSYDMAYRRIPDYCATRHRGTIWESFTKPLVLEDSGHNRQLLEGRRQRHKERERRAAAEKREEVKREKKRVREQVREQARAETKKEKENKRGGGGGGGGGAPTAAAAAS